MQDRGQVPGMKTYVVKYVFLQFLQNNKYANCRMQHTTASAVLCRDTNPKNMTLLVLDTEM